MSDQLEGPFTVRFNKGKWCVPNHFEVVDMNGLVVAMFMYYQNLSANEACSQYNDWWLRKLWLSKLDENPVEDKESWQE